MSDWLDIEYYNNSKIGSKLLFENNQVIGFWLCGNNYRNKNEYYGTYPTIYLKRIEKLFYKVYEKGKILHLFSGMVQSKNNEVTFDIKKELNPSVIGDAEELSNYFSREFDLILADPPYDNNHIKYGTKKVNKRKVIYECSKILQKNGYLLWLDTIFPMFAKKHGWQYKGHIGLVQSTNHKIRAITLLKLINVKEKEG